VLSAAKAGTAPEARAAPSNIGFNDRVIMVGIILTVGSR
jgi:hypothetical protein